MFAIEAEGVGIPTGARPGASAFIIGGARIAGLQHHARGDRRGKLTSVRARGRRHPERRGRRTATAATRRSRRTPTSSSTAASARSTAFTRRRSPPGRRRALSAYPTRTRRASRSTGSSWPASGSPSAARTCRRDAPPLIKDSDNDGIPDNADKCPTQAGRRRTTAARQGQRRRRRRRSQGQVPRQGRPARARRLPRGRQGQRRHRQREGQMYRRARGQGQVRGQGRLPDPDNDKDGVLDEADKCPTEPETKNGYQDRRGRLPERGSGPGQEVHGRGQGNRFQSQLGGHQAVVVPALEGSGRRVQGVPDVAGRGILRTHLGRG